MKTPFAIFTVLGVLLFIISMGSAHLRLDETFVAPMLPIDGTPGMHAGTRTIVLDGDGSEWQLLPRQYYLTHDDLKEVVKGGFPVPNPASLAVKVVIGWSPVTNMIYMWEERFDDFSNARLTADDRQENIEFGIDADHSGGRFMSSGLQDVDPAGWDGSNDHSNARLTADDRNEHLEFGIDTDHSGGRYMSMSTSDIDADRWDGSLAQNYRYFLNREDPLWYWGAATWAVKPPYADIGWSLDGTVGGEGVQTVEIAVTPFDDLNYEGIDQSVVHTLAAGEIVGLVFAVKDSDNPDELGYDGGWWSSSFAGGEYHADEFNDYILLDFEPGIWTAVKSDTWGRIKATFSN